MIPFKYTINFSGFYGDIAQFSVNFKSVSMKEDSSWRRHGKPDEVIHMEYVQKGRGKHDKYS